MLVKMKDGLEKEVTTYNIMDWWARQKQIGVIKHVVKCTKATTCGTELAGKLDAISPGRYVQIMNIIMQFLDENGWEIAKTEDLKDVDLNNVYYKLCRVCQGDAKGITKSGRTIRCHECQGEGYKTKYTGLPLFASSYESSTIVGSLLEPKLQEASVGLEADKVDVHLISCLFENFFCYLRDRYRAVIGGRSEWVEEWELQVSKKLF